MMQSQKMYDLAVIGAGIYGIQAARTYLSIHPREKVVVFEGSGEVGGVWSTGRVYDAFWTQTPLRILEFSDMALDGVPESETHHGFFRATHVADYLNLYVKTRIYDERSLLSRIHFYTKVRKLTKIDGGWKLRVSQEGDGSTIQTEYLARKVIDATGLTSTPNIPNIPGRDCFKGQVFHHIDFARHQQSLLESGKSQNIVVVGGAKSAADVAYACAKAGHKVHWVIRRNGSGPAAFVSPKASWPYKNSNESFYSRFTSHFLASWFFDESSTWLGRLLYKTSLGQGVIRAAWQAINRKAQKFADYDRSDGHENGFYNLRPDTEIFWQNDSTGICQRPDFFDTVARNVKVHRQDIICMTPTGLKLADETLVEADCIVFATGWTTSHPEILSENDKKDISISLGLSVRHPKHNVSDQSHWQKLEKTAEKEVLTRFPFLHNRPDYYQDTSINTRAPLRLYKGVIPIEDRTVAFVGQFLSGNNFRISEVQALYAVAALDGILHLPTTEQMERTVARTIAWNRLRYLGKGAYGSWLYWDMVPYTDDLLKELGLYSHHHGSWWKDLFAPCFASDLAGLISEYQNKKRSDKKE